jgi:hypothetical protein
LAAAIWFWILGSKPPVAELTAAALADGAGLLTYVRFRPTALTRRIQSGVLMATSGAYFWALVYSLWQHRRGSSPDWLLLLLFPPGVILLFELRKANDDRRQSISGVSVSASRTLGKSAASEYGKGCSTWS